MVNPNINAVSSTSFAPYETIPIVATSSTSSASFTLADSATYSDCMVQNAGSVEAFVGFGAPANLPSSGVLNATPVPAGAVMILQKGIGNAQCSAITSSGSATIYFTSGTGS